MFRSVLFTKITVQFSEILSPDLLHARLKQEQVKEWQADNYNEEKERQRQTKLLSVCLVSHLSKFDETADCHQQVTFVEEVDNATQHNLVFKFASVILDFFILNSTCNYNHNDCETVYIENKKHSPHVYY